MEEKSNENSPSGNNDKLLRSVADKLRGQDQKLKEQLTLLKKFHIFHWLVATLGLILFSQAMSFGRWSKFTSVENNFNDHAELLSVCGLGFIFIAAAALALHERLVRLEKLLEPDE